MESLSEVKEIGQVELCGKSREDIVWSGESETWIALESLVCWRWQNYGIPVKESCRQCVEQVQDRDVCCRQQSWKE